MRDTVDRPEVRYVRSGNVFIAYHVVGEGPLDIVFVPEFWNSIEAQWEEPSYAAFLRGLAAHGPGEVEAVGPKVGGLAVHIGSRVAALARPREVLVSSTVRDLVAGAGLTFEDRGVHRLKGVPNRWHLYAAHAPE